MTKIYSQSEIADLSIEQQFFKCRDCGKIGHKSTGFIHFGGYFCNEKCAEAYHEYIFEGDPSFEDSRNSEVLKSMFVDPISNEEFIYIPKR
jgi:hypothetical protein